MPSLKKIYPRLNKQQLSESLTAENLLRSAPFRLTSQIVSVSSFAGPGNLNNNINRELISNYKKRNYPPSKVTYPVNGVDAFFSFFNICVTGIS